MPDPLRALGDPGSPLDWWDASELEARDKPRRASDAHVLRRPASPPPRKRIRKPIVRQVYVQVKHTLQPVTIAVLSRMCSLTCRSDVYRAAAISDTTLHYAMRGGHCASNTYAVLTAMADEWQRLHPEGV